MYARSTYSHYMYNNKTPNIYYEVCILWSCEFARVFCTQGVKEQRGISLFIFFNFFFYIS